MVLESKKGSAIETITLKLIISIDRFPSLDSNDPNLLACFPIDQFYQVGPHASYRSPWLWSTSCLPAPPGTIFACSSESFASNYLPGSRCPGSASFVVEWASLIFSAVVTSESDPEYGRINLATRFVGVCSEFTVEAFVSLYSADWGSTDSSRCHFQLSFSTCPYHPLSLWFLGFPY